MLSDRVNLGALALLVLQAQATPGEEYPTVPETTCESHVLSYETTTYKTKTAYSTQTHLVDVTVPNYVNSTVTSVKTKVVESFVTECITTTLYYTDKVTNTDTDEVTVTNTDSVTVTDTDSVTITGTDYATITQTATTTATVPTTTYTTETIFSTTFDPCPTQCSVSAETVNLYFWPTDRPYSYPSTWVDESIDYTFTYPSVYMLIPTAVGTNASGPVGPATISWILPLDLTEVSTIVGSTATVQLEISDLGTDCPKTADPTDIAAPIVDSRCNPILAAPTQVSSWAYPCNACGRFGLFDPPYAAPTLTGPLVEPTTTTTVEPTTTEVPPTETVVLPTETAVPTETVVVPSETVVVPTETIVPTGTIVPTDTVVVPTNTEVPTETLVPTETVVPSGTETVVPTETVIPTETIPDFTSTGVITDPIISSTPSVTPTESIPITAGAASIRVTLGMLMSMFVTALFL